MTEQQNFKRHLGCTLSAASMPTVEDLQLEISAILAECEKIAPASSSWAKTVAAINRRNQP
ncbi:hypothetical protein EOD23_11580 [Mesorhizobium sp. USDA-HM6]|nr:hypothetical protein EOD23_11580 [Mesorhizobium sp. USDA-HM6]